ncbi:hypothetical protein PAMC26577_40445 [Caballeronia sordidicola]|uniref:Uncharacterized protein n=1 Tax=Caballeronia sordidicola TaxID=196367 RepID=A0A242M2D7_CABSO|nr:hypothetical protein PAMC26577_40445 [Caballeronia sordidicola]
MLQPCLAVATSNHGFGLNFLIAPVCFYPRCASDQASIACRLPANSKIGAA